MPTTDDILSHIGPWHYTVLMFCFYRGFPYAYHAMITSFTAPNLEHWCAKPVEFSNWTKDEWIARGIPHTIEDNGESAPSRCEMFEMGRHPDGSVYIEYETKVPCTRWEFDMDSHTNTLTNQFNLVCDRVWLRAGSQSIYMLGLMVGMFVYSHLSDWYGRKRASAYAIPVALLGGVGAAFSKSFLTYNICRVVTSLGMGGLHNISFTFVAEVLSARNRSFCSLFTSGGWTTGLLTLSGIAWLIRDWMHLQVAITMSILVFCVILPFLPESPRWLLATTKYEEAKKTLEDAAKKNKVQHVDVARIVKDFKDKMMEISVTEKPTFVELFRLPCLRWTTCLTSAFAVLNLMVYYNLTYASTLLGGNPYLCFVLVAITEYPIWIVAVLLIKYIKRRPSYLIVLSISAICSAASMFLPKHMWGLHLCFAAATKFGVMCANAINFVQLSELYPTGIRNVGIGFNITMSRVGAILAPFTKELGIIFAPWVPKAVDTVLCITMALLGVMLPETYQIELPDTVQDIKNRRKKTTIVECDVPVESVEIAPLHATAPEK